MPNQYSIEIHDHISARIEGVEQSLAAAVEAGDVETEDYCRGQLEELLWLREYLRQNVDLKDFTYY